MSTNFTANPSPDFGPGIVTADGFTLADGSPVSGGSITTTVQSSGDTINAAYGYNVLTSPTNNGVYLPAAVVGKQVFIYNGATVFGGIVIYNAASGETVNGASTVTNATKESIWLTCYVTGSWVGPVALA
jgi:hypothetical protein